MGKVKVEFLEEEARSELGLLKEDLEYYGLLRWNERMEWQKSHERHH